MREKTKFKIGEFSQMMQVTVKTLRQKALRNNRISLYLDYYPGIRNPYTMKMSRREFLGIYLVFKGLTRAMTHHQLKQWIAEAGIRKKITFHCLRHSHLPLSLETNDLQKLNLRQVTI